MTNSRIATRALRIVIVHSLLLIAAPLAQSQTSVSGGWIDATLLLLLLIAGPAIGIGLYLKGLNRQGSIVLLAFMPAAAYSHIRIILALFGETAPMPEITAAIVLFGLVLLLLTVSSVFGSVLSFALLRGVHAAQTVPERNDHS